MMACIQNHADLTRELCQRGADVNLKAGGKTALMHAAAKENPECVEILLGFGADASLRADVDDSEFTEYDGLTPLEMVEADVARNGMRPRSHVLLRLLRGASNGLS